MLIFTPSFVIKKEIVITQVGLLLNFRNQESSDHFPCVIRAVGPEEDKGPTGSYFLTISKSTCLTFSKAKLISRITSM